MINALELLKTRRSVLVKNLTEPGPNESQLQTILEIAARVPDHRKLEPWRFIIIQGNERKTLSEKLCEIKLRSEHLQPEQIEAEQCRFLSAPLIIVVAFSPVEHKTPVFEQLLSTGAVCQNINLACSALGFSSQWVTQWCAFDKQAQAELGLQEFESIAGFIHIGSTACETSDRQRPDLQVKTSYYKG
jgi:nitroreductase